MNECKHSSQFWTELEFEESFIWGSSWIFTCKRMKFYPNLILDRKINSKWYKNLPVNPETVKLLEENIKILDIGLDKDFFLV